MDRNSLSAAACALAIVAPLAASAADITANYYTPPKLKTQGTSKTPVGGAGTVVVKVLVTKTGAATVQGVIKSTNHRDDAAALEIAKSSTYRPATRGSVAQTAFYDFTLKFASNGSGAAQTSAASGEAPGGLAGFEREIRAANYAGAQSGLQTFIAAHPSDTKAQVDLGVASAFLGQYSAAAEAFDKAGTVPDNYKALAAKAYNDAASEKIVAKDYPVAIADAKHAVALAPSPFTYNTLGTAEEAANDHTASIADLEKARSLAAAISGFKGTDLAKIDANLVLSYLAADKADRAKPILDEIAKSDPSATNAQQYVRGYYEKSASDLVKAKKFTDAAALYEKAAVTFPSIAATEYANAAFMYLQAQPKPDNDHAKADADKALALDPNNASANFAAGVSLANQPGKTKDALVFLNKADASAKAGNDTALAANVENVLKQLNGNK